jgi:peptidoglycan/LPS O-acetylase OafA/YrhL
MVARATADDQPSRLLTLDGIRGVAALVIVIGHTGRLMDPIVVPLGFSAVDLFFLLSGIVIDLSYRAKLASGALSPYGMMRRRVIRLYPLYAVGTAITLAGLVIHRDLPVSFDGLFVLISLAVFMLPATLTSGAMYPLDPPAWSLFFELIANFIYASYAHRLGRGLWLLAAFGLVLLVACYAYSLNEAVSGLARVMFSFFLGVIIARAPKKTQIGTAGSVAAIALLFALLMAVPHRFSEALYFCYTVIAFPVIVYCVVSPACIERRAAVCMSLLGRASYPIYTIHLPLIFLLESFGWRPEAHPPWTGLLFLAALVPLGVALDQLIDTPIRAHFARRAIRVPEHASPPVQRVNVEP